MDLGPRSPNNEFIEAGKKASLILGKNIRFRCKRIKDTSMECNNKSPRTCPRDLIFLFSVPVPFSPVFPRLIYHGFFAFFIIHVWTWHSTSLSSSPSPFLESSILSWKAVRSLFRYHLHINAARRLAGRHLMRR